MTPTNEIMAHADHIAAFSIGHEGGNPAGVAILDALPEPDQMQAIARAIGYSETVFAARERENIWRTRYFAPTAEVPFCGHATIALGAMLAARGHVGDQVLRLNDGEASVCGNRSETGLSASFESPPTGHEPIDDAGLDEALSVFGYDRAALAPDLRPAILYAGARHMLLPMRTPQQVAAMAYDLDRGADLMREAAVATVMIAAPVADRPGTWHVRNPFASGGVYEDPATGAAAAAFAGYLRALGAAPGEAITIEQGVEMGVPCRISAVLPERIGGPAIVRGAARLLSR